MLLRNASHYFASSVVTALFGFLSAMVFTRLLSPSDYGVYIVGASAGGFISAVLFSWVRNATMRFQSEGGAVDLRLTALGAFGLSAAFGPLAVVAATLAAGLPLDRAAGALVFALGLGLFELGQELMKSRLQVRAFVFASFARSLAAFALCLIAAELGGGGLGQLLMAALAYFVAAAFTARDVWRAPRAPFDRGKLVVFLKFGGPITVAGFVFAFHGALDRLFVAWSLGDQAAGLYGASADLVRQIILIPAGSIASAAMPLAVRALVQGGADAARPQIRAAGELLLAVMAPAAAGLAMTAPYLAAFLLGPAYRETAGAVMPILAFAWLVQAFSQNYLHISFHLAKRPEMTVYQGLATLAVNFAALWPLTARFGLPGAAASVLAAETVGAAVGLALTRYGHPLPLPLGPLARIAAAAGLMAAVLAAVETRLAPSGVGAFAALAAIGAMVYGAAALAFNVGGARRYFGDALARRLAAPLSAR